MLLKLSCAYVPETEKRHATATNFDAWVRVSDVINGAKFYLNRFNSMVPHMGSENCGSLLKIYPIRFLDGCRKRRLNQG